MGDAVWVGDLVGSAFEQCTLTLEPDGLDAGADPDSGVEATLVRSLPGAASRILGELRSVDVLYVHGWSDYFFQTDLAHFFTEQGARFYALDLRRYGRSLRPGQRPGYITSLDAYDEEIGAALEVMGTERAGRRLVLFGHSTGGLTLTLWAARHPGRARALILNSPWLELQLGPLGRQVVAPLVGARARFDPLGAHPVVDLGLYTRAQREIGSLPASPPGWRPERGFPTHPGWLAAVIAGHQRVASGVDVGCPALVLLSTRSTPPLRWLADMTSTDSVLVVDEIARAATRIASTVTIARIDGAIHDVFLSSATATGLAYEQVQQFVRVAAR